MNDAPQINLHIEELVLHGFAPGDRHGISAAVERELTRLLAEQPLSSGLLKSFATEQVDGGSFSLRRNARPEVVGEGIARAIQGGLAA